MSAGKGFIAVDKYRVSGAAFPVISFLQRILTGSTGRLKGDSDYADNLLSPMNKQINFGDTIFILNIRIRMIRDLLILDADPDFFLDTTLSDLEFIDAALGELLKALIENIRLIDRNGQFGNLHETERQFIGVLWDLANGPGAMSVASFPALREKVALIREHSLERQKIIGQSFSFDETPPSEPVVSSDELNELLRDF
jgi:hypothetical protein